MSMWFKNFISGCTPWRLHTCLLSSDDFVKFVSRQIDFFVSLNKTPKVSASVLWEALKAFIRGEIISYAGYEKRLRKEKWIKLTQRIPELGRLYATHKTPELYEERLCLQAEFDSLTTQRTTELLLQTRSLYYEHGDKASTSLAHQHLTLSHRFSVTHILLLNLWKLRCLRNFIHSSDHAATIFFTSVC